MDEECGKGGNGGYGGVSGSGGFFCYSLLDRHDTPIYDPYYSPGKNAEKHRRFPCTELNLTNRLVD